MKFKLLEVVRLVVAVPDCVAGVGAVGTVVMVYTHPEEGYEVEFCDQGGRTVELKAFHPSQLEPLLPPDQGDAS